jgi:hypothetical protein
MTADAKQGLEKTDAELQIDLRRFGLRFIIAVTTTTMRTALSHSLSTLDPCFLDITNYGRTFGNKALIGVLRAIVF